ncbi:MAG: benzoate-CoA ligase family protein [Rhodocyclales bacterium]|nr:benzoate-CoA ligase family protein [Rhodocyclales bacterium]
MNFEDGVTMATMNAADEIIGRPLAQGLGAQAAILCDNRSVSFAELNAEVNRYGNALHARGVARGERVLFLMDDSPELVAAYLGTLRIGAVAVALNVRLAPRDLLYVIQDSACRVIFVDAHFLDLYESAAAGLDKPPLVVVVGGAAPFSHLALGDFLAGQSDRLESVSMDPEEVGFWLYSSGTTGKPKAVMHPHRSVLVADHLERLYLGVRPGDRVFTTSKIFFGFALGHSLMGGLQCGATIILSPAWPEPGLIISTVERHRPTVLFSTPVMYRNLLREGAPVRPAFRAIRHFVSAGEKLPESLYDDWLELCGKPILDCVGASETVFLFLVNPPDASRGGASGKRVPWAEVRLVDEDGRDITEPETPGQIAIRTSCQFVGYWQQPELSARTLRDGWYYPGDMFRFDAEGYWYHMGRADDMLKISGQWVSPAEIEACALTVPGVAEAAVVGFPNEDGLTRIALFAIARDAEADTQALTDVLLQTFKSTLSIYKCPRTIRFVAELPRTATGKMQRFRLREILRNPAS